MSDWTSGYVAEIGYTYGYYSLLNPLHMRLAFLARGLALPKVGNACELGFGQGVSANMHAAAGTADWYGTDFNPSQAAFAQELAEASGSSAKLYDQSFEEFCMRDDLPEFDYIGMHGIWSWISHENRSVIVDFIRRKLKVGGVLYTSYNTQPGWSAMGPLRDLLTEHTKVMGVPGDKITNRIEGALEFADKLMDVNPTYAVANPQLKAKIEELKGKDRSYLAHEYFNSDWLPMSFAKVSEWLTPAKLQFACSALYLDHVDSVNLTSEQQKLLNEVPDATFREMTRDMITNQNFRRDYWVKGARTLNGVEQAEALRKECIISLQPAADVSLTVIGSLGEASMQEDAYRAVLDVLDSRQVVSLGELEEAVASTLSELLEIVMVLAHTGVIHSANSEADSVVVKEKTDALNGYLMNKARSSADVNWLVSPVTGGGVAIGRFHQLFLLAISQGLEQPEQWASFAWDVLASQGQRLSKEGKTLATAEENLAELTSVGVKFAEKRLPKLKALKLL